jgi:ribosomal protein S18 acetylase RimI-like enzyme
MTLVRDEITYKEIENGNVEVCRDLCNALMAHQADRGVLHPEVLRAMSFDNRLKPSFEGAEEKQIIIAFDGGKPIGYVYSSAGLETEASKTARPAWAAGLSGIHETGFYPDWLPLPGKIGCLNNLYVLPEYRGRHIASSLCDKTMSWLRSVTDIKYIFVYISNGNNSVIDFYKNYGFEYSHEVFGGFIIAYYQKV